MDLTAPDVDAVTQLIEDVAKELVVPRFRQLQAEEIEHKATADDPEDVVTSVDREVEVRLTEGLSALMPSAVVVGEEATYADPELLTLVHGDRPVWLIDPIDGTKNFATGDRAFGIMVGLVGGGLTRAAWILFPAEQLTFVAERGSGAYLNGARVRVPPAVGEDSPRGTILSRYMPDVLRHVVVLGTQGRFRQAPPSGCAASEYMTILRGGAEFVVYYRLLPWDHAAPALILSEGGGLVEHVSGEAYSPRSSNQLTIVARDETVARVVRGWLPREG